jgi:hypothetical protein
LLNNLILIAGWCNGDTTDRIEIWLGSVGSTPGALHRQYRCTDR